MAECDRLQPRESLAAAGAAEKGREVVADESAAAVGEGGWAVGQTCPLLLADAGRERFDAEALRGHGAADRGVASASGVGEGCNSREIGQPAGEERKGVGGISHKGHGCRPQGPREEQDDPLGTAGQAFSRRR